MLIFAPAERVYRLVDAYLAECERHRWLLAGFFIGGMGLAAATPQGGYLYNFGIAVSCLGGAGSGPGFVSRWRGWVDD